MRNIGGGAADPAPVSNGYQAVPPPGVLPPGAFPPDSPPPRPLPPPGQVPTRSFPTRDITHPALSPRILYTIKNSGIHIIKRRIKNTANGLEKIMHRYKNMRK